QKVLILALCSLALVAADVSHLFGHDHHHHHHHEEEHPGYNYDPPQIPFELPTPASVYLPAKVEPVYLPPAQPKPAYLPPAPPKPAYLPPVQQKPVYVAPVVEEVASLPIEPEVSYLPPAPVAPVVPTYKIPIPSYAEPLEPVNSYLPPQEVVDDGYHYDAPSKPFFY
ncbi:hypothetical protein KR044_009899, partial [Drosophila immigrans]